MFRRHNTRTNKSICEGINTFLVFACFRLLALVIACTNYLQSSAFAFVLASTQHSYSHAFVGIRLYFVVVVRARISACIRRSSPVFACVNLYLLVITNRIRLYSFAFACACLSHRLDSLLFLCIRWHSLALRCIDGLRSPLLACVRSCSHALVCTHRLQSLVFAYIRLYSFVLGCIRQYSFVFARTCLYQPLVFTHIPMYFLLLAHTCL